MRNISLFILSFLLSNFLLSGFVLAQEEAPAAPLAEANQQTTSAIETENKVQDSETAQAASTEKSLDKQAGQTTEKPTEVKQTSPAQAEPKVTEAKDPPAPAAEKSVPAPPDITNPKVQSLAPTTKLQRTVSLEWEPVEGVTKYEIEISSDKVAGFQTHTESLAEAKFRGHLEPGAYQVRVRSYDERNISGEWSESFPLKVAGQLEPPKVKDVEVTDVQALEWSSGEDTKSYTILLTGKVGKKKEMKTLTDRKGTKQSAIRWKRKLPPGEYRLEVRAEGSPWIASEKTVYEFTVPEPPPRKPAFTPDLTSQTRLRRDWNHQLVATYLITGMAYNNQSPELATHRESKFQTAGGTGRLGYRYEPENSYWGAGTLLDYSGFIVEDRNNTFASWEFTGHWVHRTEYEQTRIGAGIFYKQLPYIRRMNNDELTFDRLGYTGPMAFIDYRKFGGGKHGFKFDGAIYRATRGVQMPNGKGIDPTNSYEAGIAGSYAFNPHGICYYGVAQRFDHIYFDSTTQQEDAQSAASNGDKNEVSVTGTYFRLSLEFGF